jgi:hypothetical protein
MDKNKKAMLGTDSKESAMDKIKLSAPPTSPTLPSAPQPTNTIPSLLGAPKLLNTKNPSILSSEKLLNPTAPAVFKPSVFVPQAAMPQAETIDKLKADKNRPKGVELIKALVPKAPTAPVIQADTTKFNPKTSTADNIKNNEAMLDEMDKKIKEMTGKKLQKDTLKMLQPAFTNIAATVNQSNKDKGSKDYDSEHITVHNSQSLFTLTANQISGTPSYRVK